MTDIAPNAVFVYGTLKQGECRASLWPVAPLEVQAAIVAAAIYDLGEYPCLLPGEDPVAGELWRFAPEAMPQTLDTLDQIEGYSGQANDLYHRVTITGRLSTGLTFEAWTYFYAHPADVLPAQRIDPDPDGLCRWPSA